MRNFFPKPPAKGISVKWSFCGCPKGEASLGWRISTGLLDWIGSKCPPERQKWERCQRKHFGTCVFSQPFRSEAWIGSRVTSRISKFWQQMYSFQPLTANVFQPSKGGWVNLDHRTTYMVCFFFSTNRHILQEPNFKLRPIPTHHCLKKLKWAMGNTPEIPIQIYWFVSNFPIWFPWRSLILLASPGKWQWAPEKFTNQQKYREHGSSGTVYV